MRAMMITTIFEHGEGEQNKEDVLNFDTLIIQYNAAIRKEGGPLSVTEKKEKEKEEKD